MEENVLLVDDDVNNLKLLRKVLDLFGFTSDSAHDAKSAIKMIQTNQFQLVITDKNMPGIEYISEGGMDVLNYVRKHNPAIPVIMLTGYATVESAIQAMKLGAFDYLSKPFEQADLKRKLSRATQYQKFLNPSATLKDYQIVHRSILDVLANNTNFEGIQHKDINEIDEILDNHFLTLKSREELIIVQRDALSRISGLVNQLMERLEKDLDGYALAQRISHETLNNI